jgi:hypothetical protein
MKTTAAGRQIAIFCQSGPTPAVIAASVASSRAVGILSMSVIPCPAAIKASSAVSIGVADGITPAAMRRRQKVRPRRPWW